MEFKVGDKVRIIKGPFFDGDPDNNKYIGKIATITYVSEHLQTCRLDNEEYLYSPGDLEPVEETA